MALTFGTLLSSQGADAHVPRPIPRPFFVAVIPTLHRAPQQPHLRGSAGGFPDPLRPGPFSLGAEETIHAVSGACTRGPRAPVRVPGFPHPEAVVVPRRQSGSPGP